MAPLSAEGGALAATNAVADSSAATIFMTEQYLTIIPAPD